MNIIEGNLIELAEQSQFDVIVHGCNCFNVMGKGIAFSIANSFQLPKEPMLEPFLEISLNRVDTQMADHRTTNGTMLTIVNGYTQYHPGKHLNFNALESVFGLIALHFVGLKIGYPLIGCGIAGGKWEHVSPLIDSKLYGMDHSVVLPKSKKIMTVQDEGSLLGADFE